MSIMALKFRVPLLQYGKLVNSSETTLNKFFGFITGIYGMDFWLKILVEDPQSLSMPTLLKFDVPLL
jgi:hypothetical protein